MKKLLILLAFTSLTSAHAAQTRTTKFDSNGYFMVVHNITYDYSWSNSYCSDEDFEMFMLTDAMEEIYDKDNRSTASSSKSKGLIVKFVQTSTITDDSGNEKDVIKPVLQFTIAKSGLGKINKDFGLSSTERLLSGRMCSKVPRQITYIDYSGLEKYIRVFQANGGKIQYNPNSWSTPLKNSVKF